MVNNKYANGNRGYYTDIAKNAAVNDPMFALGQLIAANWNKNYEDRGIRKAQQGIDSALSGTPNPDELNAALDEVTKQKQAQNYATLGTNSPSDISKMVDTQGLNTPMGIARYNNSYLNDPNNFLDSDEFSQMQRNKASTAQDRMQALKDLGYVPQTFEEKGHQALNEGLGKLSLDRTVGQGATYGNIDTNQQPVVKNPDGSVSTVRSMSFDDDGKETLVPTVSQDGKILSNEDAINEYRRTGRNLGVFDSVDLANAAAEKIHKNEEQRFGYNMNLSPSANDVAQQAANKRINNFKADVFLADQQKNLMAKGYTSEQIDMILAPYKAKAAEVQKEQDKAKAAEYIKILENTDFSKGYDPKILAEIIRLKEYDPEAANMYAKNLVTGKDQWNLKVDDYKTGRNFNYQQKGADNQLGRGMKLSSYNANQLMAMKQAEYDQKVSRLVGAGVAPKDAALLATGFKPGNGLDGGQKQAAEYYKVASNYVKSVDENLAGGQMTFDQLSPQEKTAYNQAKAFQSAYMSKVFGGSQGGQQNQQGNLNDYETAIPYFQNVIDTNNGKFSNQDIIGAIRKTYGLQPSDDSSDFVEKIISDLGLESGQKTVENNPAEEQQGQEDEEEQAAQERLKQERKNAAWVNPYTGTPYASNPWTGRKNG